MKKVLLVGICALTLPLGVEQLSKTQTKQEESSRGQEKNKPKIVALHPNDSEPLDWDGGKVRFIASSEETTACSGRAIKQIFHPQRLVRAADAERYPV